MDAIIEIMMTRAGWLVAMAGFLGLGLGWLIWGRKLSNYEELIDDINVDRSERTRRANSLEVEITSAQSRFDNQIAMRNRQITELETALASAPQKVAQLQSELAFHQQELTKLREQLRSRPDATVPNLAEWKKAVRARDAYIKRLEGELRQRWDDQGPKTRLSQTG